jgi:hypothetical protein
VTAPAVQRVLTLNGFDRLIPVYPSLAAAIAATGTSSTVPVAPGSGIPGAAQPETLTGPLPGEAGMTLHDRSGLAGTLPQHRSAARHGSAHPAPSALSISPLILAAKITPPGLPGWTVPRPRIAELIAQGTRWSL